MEGDYIVTSPLEPALITEAESVSEPFENARDALKARKASPARILRHTASTIK